MSLFTQQIQQKNEAMYNAFPYPGYSFFFHPQIQSAYLGASWFARAVCDQAFNDRQKVAILGCGDTQPYIARKIEHPQTKLECVDLAARSLSLARRRCFNSLEPIDFIHKDLIDYLKEQKDGSVAHIDVYGVLHHLSDPFEAFFWMEKKLARSGTVRLMIYNSKARDWIRLVQKLARTCGFEADKKVVAKDFLIFLRDLSEKIPFLKQKLSFIPLKFSQIPRLIDAFLHVREMRRDISYWQNSWEDAGFIAKGLFDRYAQMDHLPNPLWSFPPGKLLAKEADRGLLTGSWEVYLMKQKDSFLPQIKSVDKNYRRPLGLFYPKIWDEYQEIASLSRIQKMGIWQSYLAGKHRFLPKKPLPLQRFARLGILLPNFCPPHLEQLCAAAMTTKKPSLQMSFQKPPEDLLEDALAWWQDLISSRDLALKTKRIELGRRIIIRLLSFSSELE